MGFRTVSTHNVRNLENQEIDTDASDVFLIGENGQGKTNFIETIYLLCYGSSFRTKKDDLIKSYGEDEVWIRGTYSLTEGLVNTIFFTIKKKKKEIYCNQKRIKDRKELVNNIPCIIFSHNDIQFIVGSPDRQRWFFNQTISLYNPLYIDLYRKYQKVLKIRNDQLKKGEIPIIDIYDEQLIYLGLEIQRRRENTIEEFNSTFKSVFHGISDIADEIRIEYDPSWRYARDENEVKTVLEKRKKRDLEFGTTTSGPHRDKIRFLQGKRNFADVASTGQLRLMSLSLRVAQAVFFSNKTGRKPVVLLDDVLLELDAEKRKQFVGLLPDYEQAFFTFLPDERFERFQDKKALKYRVVEGKVLPYETSP